MNLATQRALDMEAEFPLLNSALSADQVPRGLQSKP
jgi:hypothetical protein